MRHVILRAVTVFACFGSSFLTAPVQGADWLMLQGTEPEGASARARLWGFVQPQYAQTDGTTVRAGGWEGQDAVFNVIPPDLESDSQFSIRRARLGVRGTGFPLDSNVNYFLLAEFGNNGITRSSGGSVKLTDASVTLNHLKKFTRLRFGQFKTPGSEDGLQAIHVHNYVNFALPTDQLLLERFRDSNGQDASSGNVLCKNNSSAAPSSAAYQAVCLDGNGLNGSVGAFRDIGVQLFNTFSLPEGPGKYPWELSYAFMVGNGNGINRGDNNDKREFYYYLSAGQVFSGKGARRQDWKAYAWYEDGERTTFDSGTNSERDFDRTRWGLGGTLRWKKYRLYGEYMQADGMIANGTTGGAVGGAVNSSAFGPGGVNPAGTAVSTFNILSENKARGWYLDFGYKVLPNLELDVRYDVLKRGTEGADTIQRDFDRWTIGAQYFFNKKTRFVINYEFRNIDAPDGTPVADDIVAGIDDLLAAQILVLF